VAGLYLDTSAVLRAVLEQGTTPDLEQRIEQAPVLVTSRLSQVEASRALHRLRQQGGAPEAGLADAERQMELVWQRCELWEISRSVCELARQVAPASILRALDAIHLATFVLARRRIGGLELLSADQRLQDAASTV
jgi:predicted nucleic acid-binding protein